MMGNLLHIVTPLHTLTPRNYIDRMMDDKVSCMKVAREYGKAFWDGDRRYGYGGYRYDGRWESVAKKLIENYQLPNDAKILDVGCGKGFLLHELKKLLPASEVKGFDISAHAIESAKEEIKSDLFYHGAESPYPFKDKTFDLVISLTTLHNLFIFDLKRALSEIERVGKKGFIVVESYRNETELFNLQCWALTCNAFYSDREWIWLFEHFGYSGDYEFIYFE